jgi:DNA-binding transcriptional MocR family regulator
MNDYITAELSDGFCIVPPELQKDVAEHKITPMAQHIYITLRGHWGGYPKIFPKQSTIAEKAGVSVATVEKSLAALKKHGWIMSQRQKISHGQNRYWICNKPFQVQPPKESK